MTGLLQAADVVGAIPFPTAELAIAFLFGLLAGLSIPTGYGLERLAGFGRELLSKIPYRAPPGMDEDEALRRTAGAGGDVPDKDEDDSSV